MGLGHAGLELAQHDLDSTQADNQMALTTMQDNETTVAGPVDAGACRCSLRSKHFQTGRAHHCTTPLVLSTVGAAL